MLTKAALNDQVAKFLEALNAHDIEKMKLLFSETATLVDPFLPAPLTSKSSILAFWSGLFNAFPDMRHQVDDLVVDEGKAFVAFTTSGVGKGSLGPVNVDGKRVDIQEGYLLQLDEEALISRFTVFLDTAKLSRQLNV